MDEYWDTSFDRYCQAVCEPKVLKKRPKVINKEAESVHTLQSTYYQIDDTARNKSTDYM